MLNRILLIIVLLITGNGSQAQTVFRSVEDVWKYADTHNITIKTINYELKKSGYATKQAYSAMLPQVNATGSYTDNIALQTTLIPGSLVGSAPGTYRTLQFGQQFVYSGGINAQMNILNLQNWYATRIAKETEEMNKDSVAGTRKMVYQQLATQYYSYLLMQEAERLAAETVKVADSVFQSASNKFKEGLVNEANVDVAKLNMERAQQTQITAHYQMQVAGNNLKALLGLALKDPMEIVAKLTDDMKEDGAGTFKEDPSLRLALWRTKINLIQYKQANSTFVPTVNILYNYATQRSDKTFEPFDGARGVAGWFPSQYWSLQASWPLFTSGNRYFQSRKNKLSYQESMEQYENVKNLSAINDENIRINYQKATEVLYKTKEVMQLSYENYRHVANRYEAGITPIDDRLNAFRDYLDYQNQYLNSLSDMLIQLYQIKIRQQAF